MKHYEIDEEVKGAFNSLLRAYRIWEKRTNPENEQNLKNVAREFQRICNQKYGEEMKASVWFKIIGEELNDGNKSRSR